VAKAKGKQAYRGKSTRPPKAQRQRRNWIIGGSIAVVAAVVVGYLAYQSSAGLPGKSFPDQGNAHIQSAAEPHVAYNSNPPTSGPHLPYIAPWGVHTEAIPKELQVHNLEDGGVVVQYNCPTPCPELVDKLKAVVVGHSRHVVLAPYPGMKQRIALTAWTRLDEFDEFDEARVQNFIRAYKGIDHHKR